MQQIVENGLFYALEQCHFLLQTHHSRSLALELCEPLLEFAVEGCGELVVDE